MRIPGTIAVDGAGTAYVTGSTASRTFATTGIAPTTSGNLDAFVARLPTVRQAGLTWNTGFSALPQPLNRPAVARGDDGAIYVFGGTYGGVESNATWIYHPITDTWTPGATMPITREGAQAITLPNHLIAVLGGGQNCGTDACTGGRVLSQVDVYDPATDTWNAPSGFSIRAMSSPRYRFAAVLYQGRIYALGGTTGSTITSTVESVDATTSNASWVPATI